MGESSYTMKTSGCLVTCIATASSIETREMITPGELNRIFSAHNVYDSEGNIQWTEIAKIDGYFVNVCDEVSEDIIYQCLRMDPLEDEVTKLSDYMNLVYAVRIVELHD